MPGRVRCLLDRPAGESPRRGRPRALRRHALGRRRARRRAHLPLLLARLAQPRPGRLRRGGGALVGGLRDDLDRPPAGRAVPLADDRRAPRARRDDRARDANRGRPAERRSRSRFALVALALRDPIQDDLLSGNETLYWIYVASVLCFAASFFARGFLAGSGRFAILAGLLVSESASRAAFALLVALGITQGQDAIALGIVAAPIFSLDRRPARVPPCHAPKPHRARPQPKARTWRELFRACAVRLRPALRTAGRLRAPCS